MAFLQSKNGKGDVGVWVGEWEVAVAGGPPTRPDGSPWKKMESFGDGWRGIDG